MSEQPTPQEIAQACAEREAAGEKLNAHIQIFEAECRRGHSSRAAETVIMVDMLLQDYLVAIQRQHDLNRKIAGL